MPREMRILVVTVAGVAVLFFALGSVLPDQWQVESTMRLPAQRARVVPLLQDFGKWQQWSSIASIERADTPAAVEGQPGTVGHQLVWRSADGEAALRLSRAGDDGIAYDFLSRLGTEELRVQGHGDITVNPDGDGCLVRWRDVGVVASFAARWFAWFGAQQDAYQRFQESSLAGLRVAVEGK
jgi:Polyketide cyclase / dehydrase and lipid transport